MSCQFAHYDGAYVLGALPPAERQDFERHLTTCTECALAVRELAGLPGLLARVDPASVATLRTEDPVPDTLLPALVGAVRRFERRRQLATAGIAAAAALVVGVLIPTIPGALDRDRSPTGASPSIASTSPVSPGMAMTPVGRAPLRASLTFQRVPWGTRLDMSCTYSPGSGQPQTARLETYALFVQTRNGGTQQVGTWHLLEGETMRLTAATSANRQDITSVEVREADDKTVLELRL